ncbi:TPA: MarR family transcriptional regulator [Legionella pneumophila]|uniref:MarR family transcriptional regulator n=1 Tax=Legionella pneumophila TaxID=446 RepID=A0AAN5Q156_LEGPN|nr:MarR family transcriptional regulator [Legionella pneumophila]HAT9099486.1 MarR family transcriptional regulator [Legionella pneumophila subsp. pneumophila]MDW8869557.1 MarR family transcriptional regulator [Legionella pneumophila]MDW8915567.1 MarR family transcriptional regulator [Legionella pneumophila]MDW9077358.1 MarR family transcriptional regulator [Legionella pneumophila]MDW9083518.1 MarR family transcriptional regulator [Legionella pneumophila]
MKKLQVGIMSRNKFQSRAIEIACGRYKPKKNEPKIWFSSIESLSEVLNENNMRLLKIIDEQKPESIKELAALSKCEPGNLSRTLSTMARYGIIEMKKIGKISKPIAKALDFNIQYSAAG